MSEVFLVMLRLGCLAFGGPVAHLALYQKELVSKRCWVSEEEFADLIGFCSFLPGPTSSQVGMSLGFVRAGLGGMVAAWLGFCLPSVLLLLVAAEGMARVAGSVSGWLGGLLAGVVAIVAEAVWTMGKRLCPDSKTRTLALSGACAVVLFPSAATQIFVMILGGVGGIIWLTAVPNEPDRASRVGISWGSISCGWLILALAVALPMIWAHSLPGNVSAVSVYAGFAQSGALVFGGGHVVLPMLEAVVVDPEWMTEEQFLTGYGLTQAMPGPIFTLSAYLGAVIGQNLNNGNGEILKYAALAFGGIFAPSLGFVAGVLPFWHIVRQWDRARQALAGINAAVVGLLIAALYDPVWTKALSHNAEEVGVALALFSFILLEIGKLPAWFVLLVAAGLGHVASVF